MSPSRVSVLFATFTLAAPLHAAPVAPGAVPTLEGPAPKPASAAVSVSTQANPLPLPVGGSVNARLPKGAASVYHFEATEPGILKVAVGGQVDLVLCVATPEGLEAANGYSDDDEHGDWSESVEVPLFSAGTYTVVVSDYDENGDVPIFLASTFLPGEPQPSDELFEEDIELMRGLANPRPFALGEDLVSELGEGKTVVFRVKAPEGLYVVSTGSEADLNVSASSSGVTGGEALTPWSFPTLEAWGPLTSDLDLGGEPGREAVVVYVSDEFPTFLSVESFAEGGRFALRMVPVSTPEAPASNP